MIEKELGIAGPGPEQARAGGQVGFTELARSKPDGYTIGNLILPTVITTYLDPERKSVFSARLRVLALQTTIPASSPLKASGPY